MLFHFPPVRSVDFNQVAIIRHDPSAVGAKAKLANLVHRLEPQQAHNTAARTTYHASAVQGNVVNVMQHPKFEQQSASKAIADDRDQSYQSEVIQEAREHWRHRAEVSREYARILRGGGSLGS